MVSRQIGVLLGLKMRVVFRRRSAVAQWERAAAANLPWNSASWGWGGSARLRPQQFHSWDPTPFLGSVCTGEMFERRKRREKAHHYLEISSPARGTRLSPGAARRTGDALRAVPAPAPLPAGTGAHSPLLPLPSFTPSPAAALGGSGRPLFSTPRIDRTPERKPTGQTSLGESPHLQCGSKALPHARSAGKAPREAHGPAGELPHGRWARGAAVKRLPLPRPAPRSPAGPPAPRPRCPGRGAPLGPRPAAARPAGHCQRRAPRHPAPPRARAPAISARAGGCGCGRRRGRRAPGPARYLAAGGTADGSPRRGGESCQKRRKRGGGSGAAPQPPARLPPPPPRARLGAGPWSIRTWANPPVPTSWPPRSSLHLWLVDIQLLPDQLLISIPPPPLARPCASLCHRLRHWLPGRMFKNITPPPIGAPVATSRIALYFNNECTNTFFHSQIFFFFQ